MTAGRYGIPIVLVYVRSFGTANTFFIVDGRLNEGHRSGIWQSNHPEERIRIAIRIFFDRKGARYSFQSPPKYRQLHGYDIPNNQYPKRTISELAEVGFISIADPPRPIQCYAE